MCVAENPSILSSRSSESLFQFAKQYELPAIDFDWEYPNNQGLGCNVISANDTANFLAFLQELKADEFGATLQLSAATAINPFMDETGSPSTNVTAFAEVFDYIAIMKFVPSSAIQGRPTNFRFLAMTSGGPGARPSAPTPR